MKKVRAYTIVALTVMALAVTAAGLAAQKSPDRLTDKQVRELITNAKAPADHVKLQKHYLTVAAEYDAKATEHAADAEAYRKNSSFRDTKSPVGPGTAAHCDRFAELDREAAKEARGLASAHEHMAAASK